MDQKGELRALKAEVNELAREALKRAERILKLLEQEKLESTPVSGVELNPK